jgi:hypothetical protein
MMGGKMLEGGHARRKEGRKEGRKDGRKDGRKAGKQPPSGSVRMNAGSTRLASLRECFTSDMIP